MKLLSDIDVSGKRVMVRADLDVEITNSKKESLFPRQARELQIPKVEIPQRLQNLNPTVQYLLDNKAAKIIMAGHIGRPEGREEKLSTKNLVPVLEKLLGQEITFSPDVILSPKDEESQNRSFVESDSTQDDRVVLLENLRFWPGEEANDPEFAKQLASLADVYINEAFGASHREHASIVGVPAIFAHVEDPEHSRRAAGLHLEEEVNQLTKVIKNPERPMVAIIGGAKIETKIPVIDAMAKVADWVLVGGLLASQGLALRGYGGRVVIASLTADSKDIDEESIEKFREIIKGVKTVVWNGPMGYFEGGFEKGTLAIAQAVIDSGAYSVVGGGETTEFLGSKGLLDKFSFVSSGGGALLEFLSGKELPGIKALA